MSRVLGELSEAEALAAITPLLPTGSHTLLGPGDDSAVLALGDARVVVSTDSMVEGPDFRRAWSSPFDLGWKIAAVNLADIAAMGAEPVGLVLSFAPLRILAAKIGLEVWETMDALLELVAVARRRVGTGELNRAISYALQGAPNPIRGTKEGRLLYATQVGVAPPTFVVFVKNPEAFSDAYIRHIERSMREVLPFAQVPIRIRLKSGKK